MSRTNQPALLRRNSLEVAGWWVAATPAVLVVAALFLYPALRSLTSSLMGASGLTLAYYQRAVQLYARDIGFTVATSLASLLLTMVVAIAAAGYVRLRSSRFVEWLFKIPLFVPYVVVGHAMRVFLAPHGLLNSLLGALHLVNLDRPPSIAYTWLGLALSLAWKHVALAVLLVLGAFRGIDDRFLEAARGFGAGAIRQVKDVLLPMSAKSLSVAAVLVFTSLLGSFNIPMMIGNGGGPKMLMIDVYYEMIYQNNLPVANALGTIAYLLSAGAAIYYLQQVRKS